MVHLRIGMPIGAPKTARPAFQSPRRFILTSSVLTVIALASLLPTTPVAAETWCDPSQHDAAEPPPDPPPICGTTVIRGSNPGRVRVELPQDAAIAPVFTGSDPDISIQGEGAFVGFVLRKETPAGEPGPGIAAGVLPKKPSSNSDYGAAASPYLFFNLHPQGATWQPVTLPAGTYWLYLLAGGTPVEVKLRFRSLEGNTSFAITEEVSFAARKFWPRVKVGENLFMGTDAGEELQSRGLLLAVLWAHGEPPFSMLGHRSRLCLYEGEPPESEAMHPECPSAVNAVQGFNSVGPSEAWMWGYFSAASAGPWGWKAYYANAGVPNDAGGVVAWLSYEPAT